MRLHNHNGLTVNPLRAVLALFAIVIIAVSMLADSLMDGTPGFGLHQMLLVVVGFGLLFLGVTLRSNPLPPLFMLISLPVLSTLLTLLFMEVTFRVVGYDFDRNSEAFEAMPIYFRQPIVPVGDIFFRRPGPDVWKGKVLSLQLETMGPLDKDYIPEEEVTITYDSQGFRNPDSLTDWEIAVVGDSFTELGYLKYEDLFTTRLGKLLGAKVKNLGVSHTGPLTHIFYLEQYGRSAKTRHAVLVFFEGNDIDGMMHEHRLLQRFQVTGKREYRNFKKQTSVLKASHKWLVNERRSRLFEKYFIENAYIEIDGKQLALYVRYTPPGKDELTLEQKSVLQATLAEWSKSAQKLRMTPWVVFMPCKLRVLNGYVEFTEKADRKIVEWRPTDLPQVIERLSESNGIGFIDVTEALVEKVKEGGLTYNAIDTHLSREGSVVVAQVIASAMRRFRASYR